MPQPMVVYYGQAKDDFGWPYTRDATVILRSGTNDVALHSIDGSLTPGINFALYAPLDDGRDTNRYVRNAVRTGEVVTIVVRDAWGERTLLETNSIPAVTTPGDLICVNVTAGSDSDGDGLPDEWEQWLVDLSTNPAITSVADIHAEDDFDGDGVPNGEEYRAGTFAFLDYDYFFIERSRLSAQGWWLIQFLSVPGKVYRLYEAYQVPTYPGDAWSPGVYSTTDAGALGAGVIEGDGGWTSLYIPVTNSPRAYKMHVE
ncbi:MAG TPA: hypothetical protein P5567_13280 [Kiritimatiellia bacterium]|nr:hypothetical protein [Kiritimatiellia bacterium]HRZ13416.1 hypothetical protein [Kiritimatiellia bacterium]HSA18944.1 hypothetical protein [Kiritimatiellia bacterium]